MNGVCLWDSIKGAMRRAGLPEATVHSLRHTNITMLLRNGMGLVQTQRLAGHADVRTTMGYEHLNRDDIRDQYRRACPSDHMSMPST